MLKLKKTFYQVTLEALEKGGKKKEKIWCKLQAKYEESNIMRKVSTRMPVAPSLKKV
jgi:hypothetical protein